MKYTATKLRAFSLEAGAFLLVLAVGSTPIGRRAAVSTVEEVIHVGETVIDLPHTIVTGLHNLSPNRLDPTCQECI